MDDGFFPEHSAIRQVSREPLGLLGGGPALLLQLAHPKVARGVAEHSDFQAGPFDRLLSTLDYLAMVVFGTKDEAHRVAWSAMRAHDVVNGPGYTAHDPELLLWVQATLFQVSRDLYGRMLGPLPPARDEEYYQQSVAYAELLGAPREALPPDAAGFDAYWAEMLRTLRVDDTGREQARAVLHPDNLPGILFPALAVFRLVTTGLLPEPIREQYGLPWTPTRRLAFATLMAVLKVAMNFTPTPVRHLPARVTVPVMRRFRWRKYQRPRPARRTPAR
ncbi:oxygenase MpaB family protein [Actinocorallia sp. A-T 12471]|uniref:oxygenase MpaB family protein n=1 Tax=Actinocorallia sp. A-T 12471 TaxID=3089813 RepID=UPI0029D3543D|nr:oxygenase MpaB family protein [Actinocorallia sp. A-T 12471]MDX6741269.1 oxygenase MpaB family protein [Actinocorallia sp. A-T 12471]